jgi:hypothetical protein
MVATLESALEEKLGREGGPLVAGIADPLLFFAPRALEGAARRALVEETTHVLERRFGVAHVVDLRAAPEHCPPERDESWPALVCRAIRSDGTGDLYLMLPPGSFLIAPGRRRGDESRLALSLRSCGPAGCPRYRARARRCDRHSAPIVHRVRSHRRGLLGVSPPPAAAAGENLVAP